MERRKNATPQAQSAAQIHEVAPNNTIYNWHIGDPAANTTDAVFAFLPDGRMLVTERSGQARVVSPAGKPGPALPGLPATIDVGGQGGLLDVALDPTTYLTFGTAAAAKTGAVTAGKLGATTLGIPLTKAAVTVATKVVLESSSRRSRPPSRSWRPRSRTRCSSAIGAAW